MADRETQDTNGALHEFRAAFDDDSVARKNLALRKAHDELAAAQARITQLETALRPFAKSGELFDGYEGTCLIYDPAKGREWGLSSDDLRAARRALKDQQGGKDMPEAERIEEARKWRAAAVERRDFCRRQLEDESNDEKPEPWWSAQHNTIDTMQDRINVIDTLFPELAVSKVS